jgi:hypothetical protein
VGMDAATSLLSVVVRAGRAYSVAAGSLCTRQVRAELDAGRRPGRGGTCIVV